MISPTPRRFDPAQAALAGLSLLYPLLAVGMLRIAGPGAAVLVALGLLTARVVLPVRRAIPFALTLALVPVLVAMAATAAFDRQLSVRLYPVFMNAAMLAVFAATLFFPPSMIERIARIFEPDLPPEGVVYTRNVTIAWICFFAINGAVAMWTVFKPGWTMWAVYNGFIAYVAAGLLFAGEYLVRMRVRRSLRQ